ncbi:hypothetical protein [Pseudomonas sp. PDM25]|uniref:hypothetical protein n=1 Tax=Pseudomonas sp. PDM25 TaxID=2854772 RepID=UPI001C46F5C4|nr:hypothetical protein [Pseudomonas sp. PDM25]MBV7515699.1 hypothetical protein [Pseudomonas sp. PDM25]
MTQSVIDELRQDRHFLVEGISRLIDASPKWNKEDRARGEATFINLIHQGIVIEAKIDTINALEGSSE